MAAVGQCLQLGFDYCLLKSPVQVEHGMSRQHIEHPQMPIAIILPLDGIGSTPGKLPRLGNAKARRPNPSATTVEGIIG